MGSRWMYGTHSGETWAADGCMVHTVEKHGQQMDVWYTQSVEKHGQQMDVWYTQCRHMGNRWMYGTHSADTWAVDGCMVHTVERHGQ